MSYFANSLADIFSEPDLYGLLTFQFSNVILLCDISKYCLKLFAPHISNGLAFFCTKHFTCEEMKGLFSGTMK